MSTTSGTLSKKNRTFNAPYFHNSLLSIKYLNLKLNKIQNVTAFKAIDIYI